MDKINYELIFARKDAVMNIPRRRLGSGDVQISRLGFGAWAAGGGGWSYGWARQDDAVSIKTMRRALELGINWIDTAALYGLGHSEEIVGRLLREISPSERPLIFTKCGLIWDNRHPMKKPQSVLTPEVIRRGCEDSLRRLRVERIDVLQFHWPDESGTPVEESWGELARLIDEGKVGAGGLSNFSLALLRRCERIHHVDSFQPPFSLIKREAARIEIPWCAAHNIGVVCYSPLSSGLLTDSFEASVISKLPGDDWRHRASEFRQPRLARNLALRDALRPIARRHGTTVAAIAVAWTLVCTGVTGTIVGALTPEQVDDWIGAANIELSDADLDEIHAAIIRTGAGYGRLHWFVRRIARATETLRIRVPKSSY